MMNVDRLRALCAIVDQGGFERAAQSLHLSQPALSAQIKLLESETGLELFVRAGRRKILSAAGRQIVSRARAVLAEIERLHAESAALRGLASGSLSIATGDVIACRLLVPTLARFAREHPGVRLRVWSRTSSETTALVREGGADLGIVTLPMDQSGLFVQHWKEYGWMALAGGRARPLRVRTAEGLARAALLLLEPGTQARSVIDAAFAAADQVPTRVLELGLVELQIEFARAGLGIAVVPDFATAAARATGRDKVSRWRLDWIPRQRLGIVRLSGTPSPAAAAFLALLVNPGVGDPLLRAVAPTA
jgi:DNA-binding transcriptional LysR family regulator